MLELNKIYCENCLDTMSRMPDNFIDLTITSPPYDNLRNYNSKIDWCDLIWKQVIFQLFRVTKQGGVVVWVVNDSTIKGSETGTSFKQALYFMECGFNLHDTMIYAKNSYVPKNHNRYEQCFEYMFVFSKGSPNTFNPFKTKCLTAGTKRNRSNEKQYEKNYCMKKGSITTVNQNKIISNIWTYNVGMNDKTTHNAPFPEQLANDHIISWSNENDLIYDPFMGSGTAAKMANLLKRNWVGSEISKEYCDIAEKRIKRVTSRGGFRLIN